jgi:precorrin-6B methylase 2
MQDEYIMKEDSDEYLRDVTKIQALLRGRRSRAIHVKRAKSGAKIVCPFVSCTLEVVKVIVNIADAKKDDILMDLGCGDGEVLLGFATLCATRSIGIDIDNCLCETARRRAREANVSHLIDVVNADVIYTDFSYPSIITIFLVPSCLEVLSPILKKSCRPQTKIIAYKFPLPISDWEPIRVVDCIDIIKPGGRANIFYYVAT